MEADRNTLTYGVAQAATAFVAGKYPRSVSRMAPFAFDRISIRIGAIEGNRRDQLEKLADEVTREVRAEYRVGFVNLFLWLRIAWMVWSLVEWIRDQRSGAAVESVR